MGRVQESLKVVVGQRSSSRLGLQVRFEMAQRPACSGGCAIAAACASLDAPFGAGDRRRRFDARCGACCCGPDDGRPSCKFQGSGRGCDCIPEYAVAQVGRALTEGRLRSASETIKTDGSQGSGMHCISGGKGFASLRMPHI